MDRHEVEQIVRQAIRTMLPKYFKKEFVSDLTPEDLDVLQWDGDKGMYIPTPGLGAAGGTLDAAYNYGGAGAGREVGVQDGAIRLESEAVDNHDQIEFIRDTGTITAGEGAWSAGVDGEAEQRLRAYQDGLMEWGDGTNAPDTFLERSAAATLDIEENLNLNAGGSSGLKLDGTGHGDFKEVAAPGTPSSGYVRIYAKSDGIMYRKDDAGNEVEMGAVAHAADTTDVHDHDSLSSIRGDQHPGAGDAYAGFFREFSGAEFAVAINTKAVVGPIAIAADIRVIQVYVYCRVTSGSAVAKAIVYSDTAGAPDALVLESSEGTVSHTSLAWEAFTITVPDGMAATESYWLGIHSGGNNLVVAATATGTNLNVTTKTGSDTYADGAADPFGTVAATTTQALAVFVMGTISEHATEHATGGNDAFSSSHILDATVWHIVENSGAGTTLSVAAIADGEFLKRDGTTIDGVANPVTAHEAAADPHTGYVLESLLDAKGDIIAASADNTPAKVTVGANGTILTAASGQSAGVQWQARYAYRTYVWHSDQPVGSPIVAASPTGGYRQSGEVTETVVRIVHQLVTAGTALTVQLRYNSVSTLAAASWTEIDSNAMGSNQQLEVTGSFTTSTIPANRLMEMNVTTSTGSPVDLTVMMTTRYELGS